MAEFGFGQVKAQEKGVQVIIRRTLVFNPKLYEIIGVENTEIEQFGLQVLQVHKHHRLLG